MGDEQQDVGDVADVETRLRRELSEARHAHLLQRDHIVGIEAEIGRQNAQILTLNASLRKATARANRLDQRKRAQLERIAQMQDKLTSLRGRNAALTRRVEELEAASARPSLARRVARRLRGPRR